MGDRLDDYRRKRNVSRTPEPVPPEPVPPEPAPEPDPPVPPSTVARGRNDTFVIQQHHARRLHWDLRLERDGVLVSWALPRGVPRDPKRNHLAVHTEDHPLEYAGFHGEIPAGEYGAGRMSIYDRGTYTTEKWRDDEVVVVLSGSRVSGRYVLFRAARKGGKEGKTGTDWMIHRMDPPEPGWTPMPELVRPMGAMPATRLPTDDHAWGYELDWDGLRAIAYVDGGRLRMTGEDGRDVTSGYPELRALAETLAPTECVLDGAVVAFDSAGQVSRAALQPRLGAGDSAAARRLAARTPVQYLVFDLLWLDGKSMLDFDYARRRELLADLGPAGRHWQTPPHFTGGGEFALRASQEQGAPGVVAKRLDAPYLPGRRTRKWLTIKNTRR